MIQPIVEGHGEVDAVPLLLRRLAEEMGIPALDVGTPIRRPRARFLTREGIEQAANLARKRQGCQALLFLFDADDDCPRELAPKLDQWARELSQPMQARMVLANREYEAWLLPHNWPGNREAVRDAKGKLEQSVGPSFRYDERTDQARLTHAADLRVAFDRCRSFKKLVKEVRALLALMGLNPTPWPP